MAVCNNHSVFLKLVADVGAQCQEEPISFFYGATELKEGSLNRFAESLFVGICDERVCPPATPLAIELEDW